MGTGMEKEKISGYLILAAVLAIALPSLFAVVWIMTHLDKPTLNFVGGAMLVGLPMMLILGSIVFGLLFYMAKDRRADAVERMAHSSQQPQVMVLPNQMQNGNGQMPYRYRAVLPGSGGMYQDDMVVPGVVMGEVDRF